MTETFDAFAPPAGGFVPPPAPDATGVWTLPEDQPAPVPLADFPTPVPDGAHLMPSGAWVHIRDARTLTRGDKKAIMRTAMAAGDDIDRGYGMFDAILTRLVDMWSYPHQIPACDPTAIDLLPAEDDDALTELAKDAERLLFPKPASPDDHADPASPTAPSGE